MTTTTTTETTKTRAPKQKIEAKVAAYLALLSRPEHERNLANYAKSMNRPEASAAQDFTGKTSDNNVLLWLRKATTVVKIDDKEMTVAQLAEQRVQRVGDIVLSVIRDSGNVVREGKDYPKLRGVSGGMAETISATKRVNELLNNLKNFEIESVESAEAPTAPADESAAPTAEAPADESAALPTVE